MMKNFLLSPMNQSKIIPESRVIKAVQRSGCFKIKTKLNNRIISGKIKFLKFIF